jgi:hypothetical protein
MTFASTSAVVGIFWRGLVPSCRLTPDARAFTASLTWVADLPSR